ncbi:hypothetical protein ACET3Z_021880 [Daucus carota]
MEMSSSKHPLGVSEDKAADVKKQKVDEQTKEIPPREERLKLFMDTFKNRAYLEQDEDENEVLSDGSHPMTFRDIASLELDLYETDGFDVQDYSKVGDASVILTYYDPAANINRGAIYLPEMIECAEQAIKQYNGVEGKHFGDVRVIKANVEAVCPYSLLAFIALEAEIDDLTVSTIFHRWCLYSDWWQITLSSSM